MTVDFRDDRSLSATFADLVMFKADIKAREDHAEKFKQTLLQAMGDASVAQFETGSISFKRSKDSTRLDADRLLLDHPELAAEYASTRPGSRRFRIIT